MDELTGIRDEYEAALDEVEAKRADYHAAIRRQAMAGSDLEELAASTGLGDSRLRWLVEKTSWGPGRWFWKLFGGRRPRLPHAPSQGAAVAGGIAWGRLLRLLLIIGLLPLIGWIVHTWPPSHFSMDAVIRLEEGSTREDADRALAHLRESFTVQEIDLQMPGEASPYLAWEGHTLEPDSQEFAAEPRLIVHFPRQPLSSRWTWDNLLRSTYLPTFQIFRSIGFAPGVSGGSFGQLDLGAAARVRYVVQWFLIIWIPLVLLTFFALRGTWRWVKRIRTRSTPWVAPA